VTIENEAVIEFIAIGIVAVNFHDFGDEAPTGAAFEVHDDVDGITDVGLDGAIGQVHAALQNAAREAGQGLPCGSCVHGGKASRVSGVEKLQEIESLTSAYFTELREEYACGWCELREGHLILVPHTTSPQPIRRFTHLDEAEIIGRVTGVAMRIVGGGLAALSELPRGGHGNT
jgi:hypothetical protein